MARLFLSFLGTRDYKPCIYYKDEKPSPLHRTAVRFVQEATIGLCCREWGEGDRIVIFTTDEAYKKNWLDGGHKEATSKGGAFLEGLKARIGALSLSPGLSAQHVRIPDGFSEEEIWEIFKIVFDCIQDGDEVVFDITHAFRSIPMLAIVVLSYAKILKGITIAGIYYGAFEVLGNPRDMDHIPENERLVPILDLTPIAELLEWTTAVDRLISSGDPTKVSELTKKGVLPILKASKGADLAAGTLRKIADSLEQFCTVMSTCRGRKISQASERLTSYISALEQVDILPPFTPLFGVIKKKLQNFSGDPLQDGLQAVYWCKNHGLIQQGFTILNEVLISWILRETIGESLKVKVRELPAQAAAFLKRGAEGSPEDWEASKIENLELFQRIVVFLQENKAVLDVMQNIKQFRNDINHAGYREDSIDEKKFAPTLTELLTKVASFVGIESKK